MSDTEYSSELYCPGCGYDLRAMASDRCPECGVVIDLATISRSEIPWNHRVRVGLVGAFVRTVWLVIRHPKTLARQAAQPVGYREAQLFRWIVVLLASIPLCAAAIIARVMIPVGRMVFMPSWSAWPLKPFPSQFDLLVCWLAGVSIWLVPSFAILLLISAMTGMPSFFFHPRDLPVARQNRAVALSYYACAPLVLMFAPVTLFGLVASIKLTQLSTAQGWFQIAILLGILGGSSTLLVIPLFWLRVIQLLRGATHCTTTRVIASAFLVPLSWVLMAVICLGLFPAIAGLISLMIESVGQ